jgi:hypothetical protein
MVEEVRLGLMGEQIVFHNILKKGKATALMHSDEAGSDINDSKYTHNSGNASGFSKTKFTYKMQDKK